MMIGMNMTLTKITDITKRRGNMNMNIIYYLFAETGLPVSLLLIASAILVYIVLKEE
jgi:hypothetical protein